MDFFLEIIEYIALGIEVLAVGLIVMGIIIPTVSYFWTGADSSKRPEAYRLYKIRLGRALLLGLEILVAADIVRTVALEPSLPNVATLGLLVLIRTFLSWSLVVEIEHRWPWQLPHDKVEQLLEHEKPADRQSA